jgi:hypothetical protein
LTVDREARPDLDRATTSAGNADGALTLVEALGARR